METIYTKETKTMNIKISIHNCYTHEKTLMHYITCVLHRYTPNIHVLYMHVKQ